MNWHDTLCPLHVKFWKRTRRLPLAATVEKAFYCRDCGKLESGGGQCISCMSAELDRNMQEARRQNRIAQQRNRVPRTRGDNPWEGMHPDDKYLENPPGED